jgi:Mg-chelatase subunit ChlI
MSRIFPFTAIIGMDQAKRSAIYHAIDPNLGGTVLLGHRGCAKSTLARAFSQILPPFAEQDETPFIEVPLGTTEDRLLGSIDASSLVEKGEWSMRQGLIQQANGGVLYIDEVNLLPDHLTDSILDSAASGKHRIERDGISATVDARYILIGSMNPDEGDLRPQLLDRFAHGIQVEDNFTVEERVQIVETRMEFDDNPEGFIKKHEGDVVSLKKQIEEAKTRLSQVEISSKYRIQVAETAKKLKMEGVRAELAVMRTARAIVAWNGKTQVTEEELQEAWELCLGHRHVELPPQKPEPPKPKDQNPPPSKKKSPPPPIGHTSPAPTQANPQAIQLEQATPTIHHELLAWWNQNLTPNHPIQSNADENRIMPYMLTNPQVSWFYSVLTSIQSGWKPKQKQHGEFQLQYKEPTRKANLWVFIDASRSTGAIKLLQSVRNVLLALSSEAKTYRFNVLVLKDSKVSWLVKRGSVQFIQESLIKLDQASGKSFLNQATHEFMRGIQRKGSSSKDRIIYCSDGLLSPEKGESAKEALSNFRTILGRLVRCEIPIVWLHPTPKRGLSSWIPKLIQNYPIQTISLG